MLLAAWPDGSGLVWPGRFTKPLCRVEEPGGHSGVNGYVINKLLKLRSLRIVGLAAGAAVVSGAAVLVTASAAGYHFPFSPSSRPAAASTASIDQQAGKLSALCTDFVSHFSTDLNTSPAAINAAFQKAVG